MSKTTFSEIAAIGRLHARSHVNEMGSVYIPKIMGGVDISVEEKEDGLYITLCPNDSEWKRYVYMGINCVKDLFKNKPDSSTIALQFTFQADTECWLAVLKH